MLKVRDLYVSYGDTEILRNLNLDILSGHMYVLVGPNGVGKSTVLRGITNSGGRIRGSITFEMKDISGMASHERSRLGIAYVPQEKMVFPSLTCRENLLLALPAQLPKPIRNARLERLMTSFPTLTTLLPRLASSVSGGEARKLSLMMALIREPGLILIDEISIGLDRRSVQDVYEFIQALRGRGIGIIIAEQNYQFALAVCDYVIGLRNGQVCFFDNPDHFSEEIQRALFTGAPIAAQGTINRVD